MSQPLMNPFDLLPTRLTFSACGLALLSACTHQPTAPQAPRPLGIDALAPRTDAGQTNPRPRYHATYDWERAERSYGVLACPPHCLPPTPKTLAIQVVQNQWETSEAKAVAQPQALRSTPDAAGPKSPAMQAQPMSVGHAPGRATPSAESLEAIRALAQSVRSEGTVHLVVTGHADATGTARDNERIAVRRALSVKQALVRAGVPATNISVKAAPFEYQGANTTAAGRQLNRQTLITFA